MFVVFFPVKTTQLEKAPENLKHFFDLLDTWNSIDKYQLTYRLYSNFELSHGTKYVYEFLRFLQEDRPV